MAKFIQFFYVAQQPNWGVGRLIVDVARSLTIRRKTW
jgi:hypothetical protein